jgi:hypothetical protein
MGSHCGRNTRRLRGLVMTDAVVLLVVLVFFVALLMPVMAGVRVVSTRETCAKNLSGLGKAMLIYSNDYDDELPRAGGRNPLWSEVAWNAPTRQQAYGIASRDGTGGNCTVSSCLYLLVKYEEVAPKLFICAEDPCVSEFTLAGEKTIPTEMTKLFQAWDFGSKPQTHCSYTYYAPWSTYPLTTSNDPGLAIVADRNPWLDSPGAKAKPFPTSLTDPRVTFVGKNGNIAAEMYGNSSVHNGEGQNVLFVDMHVSFETRPFCGFEDDNIYTISGNVDKGDSLGVIPIATAAGASPRNRKDSVLLHDPLTWPAPPHSVRQECDGRRAMGPLVWRLALT